MGQQLKKIVKRRRRADYIKRKADQAKLGGSVKSPAVKKADSAKKTAAKKAVAKKAPAKKVAKKSPDSEEVQIPAVEQVAEKTVEAIEETEAAAPQAEEA
jgi:hypothetical protein